MDAYGQVLYLARKDTSAVRYREYSETTIRSSPRSSLRDFCMLRQSSTSTIGPAIQYMDLI